MIANITTSPLSRKLKRSLSLVEVDPAVQSKVMKTSSTSLITPAKALQQLPATAKAANTVETARKACADIVHGRDDRLAVIVGPCSIHDTAAALDYAKKLAPVAAELDNDILVIMRTYFEKPRTTVGWKGLINDPDLDGSFDMNKGLKVARKVLADINGLGVPCATEFLDTVSPQYTADLIAWGAIGARTTESQVHRELVSGLPMPVGFKNSTAGDMKVACDAVQSSRAGHTFLGVTADGTTGVIKSAGNPDGHVILRGGSSGPNYDKASVAQCQAQIGKSKVPDMRMVVDCSHANSGKKHENQPGVAAAVGAQVAAGNANLVGVMIESNLVAGSQKVVAGEPLVYGQSITDACVDWRTTEGMLRQLAKDVRARRNMRG